MQGEPDTIHSEVKVQAAPAASDTRSQLLAFIEEQAVPLLGITCSYVQNMELATGDEVKSTAQEVVQEAIVEALDHVERFDPSRQLMAWLLGIVLNVIRRKKAETTKRQQRELSLSQLSMLHIASMSEHDLLDQIIPTSQSGPEQAVEDDEQVNALLSLVSSDDQLILRLAFLEDFERDALARRLGVTSGAARVRLHRALGRLRAAWIARQLKIRRGETHE